MPNFSSNYLTWYRQKIHQVTSTTHRFKLKPFQILTLPDTFVIQNENVLLIVIQPIV